MQNDAGQVRTASGLNILAALWLIVAPFVLALTGNMQVFWDSVIVGVIVLVLAAIREFSPAHNVWLSWVNVVLGLWLIVAPFALGFTTLSLTLWNSVLVGVVIAVLAFWSAMTARNTAVPHS